MDWTIDEDLMQFLQSIVDGTEMNQASTMEVAPLDEKCLKNTNPSCFPSKQNKVRAVDEKHTVKLLLRCDVCNKVLASRSDLQNHINLHAGGIHFECKLCSIHFPQLSDLFEHTKEVHEKSQFSASLSDEPPKKQAQVQERQRCSICSKYFSTKTTLRYHINGVHTKEISYNCPLCPKVYYWRSGLRAHQIRYHAGHSALKVHSV